MGSGTKHFGRWAANGIAPSPTPTIVLSGQPVVCQVHLMPSTAPAIMAFISIFRFWCAPTNAGEILQLSRSWPMNMGMPSSANLDSVGSIATYIKKNCRRIALQGFMLSMPAVRACSIPTTPRKDTISPTPVDMPDLIPIPMELGLNGPKPFIPAIEMGSGVA